MNTAFFMVCRATLADFACARHDDLTSAPARVGRPAICGGRPVLRQPACKPGSVRRDTEDVSRVTAIPLGCRLPGISSNLPGRPDPDIDPGPFGPAAPIRSCSRWGLPCRLRYRTRGALLPHRFTLAAGMPRRFVFCGTFPGVTPAGCYPAPYVRGARTFLPAGGAAVQPAGAAGFGYAPHGVKSAICQACVRSWAGRTLPQRFSVAMRCAEAGACRSPVVPACPGSIRRRCRRCAVV
jgi:hypothetical protein